MFAHIREDIASVLQRDPAARSKLEVVLCYPGVHALILHRVAHRFWGWRLHLLARFTAHVARVLTGIEIHPGATLGRRVFIDHGFGVVIGETAEVGDDCTIYQGVTLGGTSLYRGVKRHPTLEAGVVVGAGAKVLGGFTVGAGAKVGSNAVVVKPVPAGATAVGNPAHVLEPRGEREEKPDFSAYGVTRNMDDPISKALHALLDHSHEQDRRISLLTARLREAGLCAEGDAECTKPLDVEFLNRIME